MTIDITKPLELSDGTPVDLAMRPDHYGIGEGWVNVLWHDGKERFERNFLIADGSIRVPRLTDDKRTLRNVKEKVMRTSEECLQRMEALVKKMATRSEMHATGHDYDEARLIAKELNAEKGPKTDEEWVDFYRAKANGCYTKEAHSALMLECIAKGRELALAELPIVNTEIRNLNPEAINVVVNKEGSTHLVSLRTGISAYDAGGKLCR